jgi:hypothetical protein
MIGASSFDCTHALDVSATTAAAKALKDFRARNPTVVDLSAQRVMGILADTTVRMGLKLPALIVKSARFATNAGSASRLL